MKKVLEGISRLLMGPTRGALYSCACVPVEVSTEAISPSQPICTANSLLHWPRARRQSSSTGGWLTSDSSLSKSTLIQRTPSNVLSSSVQSNTLYQHVENNKNMTIAAHWKRNCWSLCPIFQVDYLKQPKANTSLKRFLWSSPHFMYGWHQLIWLPRPISYRFYTRKISPGIFAIPLPPFS